MNGLRVTLWKDALLARGYLLVGGAVLAIPYVILGWAYWRVHPGFWTMHVSQTGLVSGLAAIGVTALLAGSSFSVERTDRSNEFLEYLPVGRRERLLSKILFVLCPMLILSLANPLILLHILPGGWAASDPAARGMIITLGCSIILVSGVAWAGSVTVTAASALLLGLLSPFFVTCLFYLGSMGVESVFQVSVDLEYWFGRVYRAGAGVIGLIGWGLGSWLFLRS